ncbi:hypothetical protein [Ensifer sp. ENS03]|uniref:hypothetical protein n=1 Tax=Ensifer TaxID=106591 RepID=UPI00177F0CB7|nr:hypothetical protein [Ensifer sp. ENS03]MBD9555602.1 hypothetical protein [Ensifer sp. ENS03]
MTVLHRARAFYAQFDFQIEGRVFATGNTTVFTKTAFSWLLPSIDVEALGCPSRLF